MLAGTADPICLLRRLDIPRTVAETMKSNDHDPMTTDHTFTLGQAAATGRSKSTLSNALKTGTLGYRDRTESGLDAAFDRALHRL
jgi:hypothetical protein